jgi:hypothetical protein
MCDDSVAAMSPDHRQYAATSPPTYILTRSKSLETVSTGTDTEVDDLYPGVGANCV